MTAVREITLADNAEFTAQIDLGNLLRFAQNAPIAVKQLKMQNTAHKRPILGLKYDGVSDPLHL